MTKEEERGNFLETISRWFKERLLNRNVAVFSFFLFLSALFWFLNAMSKDISGKISYPVRYINFPRELALINDLPHDLSLELKGHGYAILKTRLSTNKPPVIIDISDMNYTVVEDSDKIRYYVLTFGLRDMIKRQMRAGFDIIKVNPDTIFFEFDKLVTRAVPVIVNVEVIPERQFMVSGLISSDPDTIMISGPEAVIDTISNVKTKFTRFEDVNSTQQATMVIDPVPRTALSQKKVEVTIPIEQYTEAVRQISITLLNVPDTARVRLFPDKINFQCTVALSNYKSFIDAPLKAYIDFAGVDVKAANRLKVYIGEIPSYVGSFKYNPEQVEYIIEKR